MKSIRNAITNLFMTCAHYIYTVETLDLRVCPGSRCARTAGQPRSTQRLILESTKVTHSQNSQQYCQLKQMTGSDEGREKERIIYVNECNSSAVMIACKTLEHFSFFSSVLSLCSITLRAHIVHSIELQHFIITIIR